MSRGRGNFLQPLNMLMQNSNHDLSRFQLKSCERQFPVCLELLHTLVLQIGQGGTRSTTFEIYVGDIIGEMDG